jgi:hypothetical protein
MKAQVFVVDFLFCVLLYSLMVHLFCSKLSGAFLLASRLRAIVGTKETWDLVVSSYKFG